MVSFTQTNMLFTMKNEVETSKSNRCDEINSSIQFNTYLLLILEYLYPEEKSEKHEYYQL